METSDGCWVESVAAAFKDKCAVFLFYKDVVASNNNARGSRVGSEPFDANEGSVVRSNGDQRRKRLGKGFLFCLSAERDRPSMHVFCPVPKPVQLATCEAVDAGGNCHLASSSGHYAIRLPFQATCSHVPCEIVVEDCRPAGLIASQSVDFKLDAELTVTYNLRGQRGHYWLRLYPDSFGVCKAKLAGADVVGGRNLSNYEGVIGVEKSFSEFLEGDITVAVGNDCGVCTVAVSFDFTEGESVLEKNLVAADGTAAVVRLSPSNSNLGFSHDREAENWHLLRNSGCSQFDHRTEARGPAILVSNSVPERIHNVGCQTSLGNGSKQTVRHLSNH